jgi:hypothetical protein
MEAGAGLDGVAVGVEVEAAAGDDPVDLVQGREVPVDERLVEEGPEALGGLELGRVGRQVDEPDAARDGEPRLGVPAGVVEYEHDPAVPPGAGLLGELGQQGLEEGLGHPVREVPEGLAGGRMHEGGDVEPLVAVVAESDRALAPWRPDPTRDRLQPDPVLVRGEDLDRRAGVRRGLLGDGPGELFLNASRPSGVAEAGCFGRGLWIDQPIAFRASQPR